MNNTNIAIGLGAVFVGYMIFRPSPASAAPIPGAHLVSDVNRERARLTELLRRQIAASLMFSKRAVADHSKIPIAKKAAEVAAATERLLASLGGPL